MEVWLELITQWGLPMVAVVALSAFVYRLYKKSEEREEILRAQVEKSQEVNAKAIETLAVYSERLTVIEIDIKDIKNNLFEGE